jgi:cytochrome c oxidase subunit IV
MSGHVISKNIYFAIFGALLLLTGLTTGVAYINLGSWNTPAALAIACVKATLVLLFFMHLRWSTQLNRVVWLSALLWLGLLIGILSIDFLSRTWTPVPEQWNSSASTTPLTPAESVSQR